MRKIGLKMASFRLYAYGCYRSTTVDLRSSIPIGEAEILKDKCLYVEKYVTYILTNYLKFQYY